MANVGTDPKLPKLWTSVCDRKARCQPMASERDGASVVRAGQRSDQEGSSPSGA